MNFEAALQSMALLRSDAGVLPIQPGGKVVVLGPLADAHKQVRKTQNWSRSWANFSPLQLYSHRNAWANSHLFEPT